MIASVALAMVTKDALIKQGIIPTDIMNMLVDGAIVNALALSGSNYLFSLLHGSFIDEERKRHDKAVEQLHLP